MGTWRATDRVAWLPLPAVLGAPARCADPGGAARIRCTTPGSPSTAPCSRACRSCCGCRTSRLGSF
eukprot:7161128-Alexandrium_andersonii.AAC.1